MWQEKSVGIRRLTARCVDLSPEGIRIEARDRMSLGGAVQVESREFGRMGHATVPFCQRATMNFQIGLRFSTPFGLSDCAWRKVLERIVVPSELAESGFGQPSGN